MHIFNIHLNYLFNLNIVKATSSARLKISRSASLYNSKIYVAPGASLEIGESVKINNAIICVERGECVIKEKCIIGNTNKNQKTCIIINDGSLFVDHHTKLSLERIWIRFGGMLKIGCYTNVNYGSEIRSDESIIIGSYNQISYGVRIWDTNTHNIMNSYDRRKITESHYPYYGYETSKPVTAPICIGDDCWIGEKASILKGTQIGNEIIVGYNCLLTGQKIPNKSIVVSQSVLNIRSVD